MKYIYSISQMSKLSLIVCTFSITGSVAGLFLTLVPSLDASLTKVLISHLDHVIPVILLCLFSLGFLY